MAVSAAVAPGARGDPDNKPSSASSKIHIVNAFQEVFLAKACFTVVGFCLKEAMIGTLKGTGVENETGAIENAAHLGLLPHAIATHLLLVGFVVGLRQFLDRRASSLIASASNQATLKALMSGLVLIPAWSFKACVATVIAGEHGVLCALAVLLTATILALVFTPEPLPAGEPEGIVHNLRAVLATSMGLGVGFAVHTVPQHLWKVFAEDAHGSWFQIHVVTIYAIVATALVVMIQIALDHFFLGQGHSHFITTFVNFVKVASDFVVAWAWDGILNTLRLLVLQLHPHSCLSKSGVNLLWAVLIVLLAIGVVFLLECIRDPSVTESQLRKTVDALALLVCGITVAMGFMDFIVGLYACINLHGWVIVGAWLLAVFVVLLAGLIYAGGTQLAEKLKAT